MLDKQIAVISSQVGWHTQRLLTALMARDYETHTFALPECELSVVDDKESLILPGFDVQLPAAAFVRCIPQGSFEQVTFYLDILHALEARGVQVYNCACAIERSVDKAMATFLLAQAGLPTPKTWAGINRGRATVIINEQLSLGKAVVMKPLFGAQGKDLQMIDHNHPEPEFPDNTVYYLQEFVNSKNADGDWRDWRLFVVGGRVVAAAERRNSHWVNNVAQGSRCYTTVADADMIRCAEGAAAAIGASYAGVDLIRDRHGQIWVIEVNSIPAWKGLQSVTDKDVATILVDDMLSRI